MTSTIDDDDDGDAQDNGYSVGSRVSVNLAGLGHWYPGVIRAIHNDSNRLSISYDDGDEEDDVSPDLVKILPNSPAPRPRSVNRGSGAGGQLLRTAALFGGLYCWQSCESQFCRKGALLPSAHFARA